MHQKIPVHLLESFSSTKIQQMAAEAKTLDAYRMSEVEKKKRYALAISLVSVQTSRILDNIGEMLIKRMMSIHKKDVNFYRIIKTDTKTNGFFSSHFTACTYGLSNGRNT